LLLTDNILKSYLAIIYWKLVLAFMRPFENAATIILPKMFFGDRTVFEKRVDAVAREVVVLVQMTRKWHLA